MTVRTRDNKVTNVLVMMNRVLLGIKGDDQGAEDRKEVEPKVLTNQLVTVAGDNRWSNKHRKSAMQDQSRILVMTILLLLDYAKGKVGKEVCYQ